MLNLKKHVKKHFALPLITIMLLGLTVTLFQLRADKDDWTFALRDLEGDRSALSDVVIGGEFNDGFHRTEFSIVDGQVATETEIYGHPHETRMFNTYINVGFDGVEYSIYNQSNQIDIRYRDWTDPDQVGRGMARVRPSISNIHSGRSSSANHMEYGLTKAGDQLFFAVPTTQYDVGTNGIYALEFEPWFSDRTEASGRIVDLSLEMNRENPSLSVLGLEAVGEQLALLIVEGNRLVVQVYETDGTFIGEAEVPSFTLRDYDGIQSNEENSDDEDNTVHDRQYEAFSNDTQRSLILSFRSAESTQEETAFTYYVFDLSDGVQWVDEAKGRYPTRSVLNHQTQMHARWLDDRLIIFRSLNVEHERIHIASFMKSFLFEVFERGTRVYAGELVTDVNDDWIEAMDRHATGYGRSSWEHRQLEHLRIEPVMQNGGAAHD